MDALKRTFQHVAKLLGPERALWRPFLITLVVESFLLVILWLAPHPPFSALLASPVQFVFGGQVLHYPWHPLFLYHIMRYTHDVATLLIGAYMTGIACAMVRQLYEGRPLSVSAARQGGQVRYGKLLIVWFVSWMLARGAVGGLTSLLTDTNIQRWVGIGSVVVLQALFVYAIPAAVFTGAPWWKALLLGIRETLHRPLSTLAAVLPSLALVFGFSILASPLRVDRLAADAAPELAFAFVAARLLVWTVADALMTIGIAHLWWAHRAPEPITPAAPARPTQAKRSLWPLLLLAGCLGLALLAQKRNHSYTGERLLWKARQAASRLPSVSEASPEQVAQMQDLLDDVVQAAPGTRPAAQSLLAIGALDAARGDLAKAHESYAKVVSSAVDFPDIHLAAQLMTVKAYTAQKNWTEAARVYLEIAERYPWNPPGLEAPLSAAALLEEQGSKDEAARAYKRAVRHYGELVRHAPKAEMETVAQKYLDEARRRAGEGPGAEADRNPSD